MKENTKLIHRYNAARVALATEDLATAKREGDAFLRASQAKKNRFQIRLGHEVAGMIALEKKNYDAALAHLEQANQQDPYNLYRMGLAYEGKGDERQGEGDVPERGGVQPAPDAQLGVRAGEGAGSSRPRRGGHHSTTSFPKVSFDSMTRWASANRVIG